MMGARGPKKGSGATAEALALLRADPLRTNASLARALGVSRERVRQIRKEAGLPSSRPPLVPCRACGKPSASRAKNLCPKHLYREQHGIPLDAPDKRRHRAPCSDCGDRPSKVRGRCERCAYRAEPAWRAAAIRRTAECKARKFVGVVIDESSILKRR